MNTFHEDNSEELQRGIEQTFPSIQKYINDEGIIKLMEKIYSLADQFSEEAKSQGATCGQGCSFCCHDNIPVSLVEGEYLKHKLKGRVKNGMVLAKQKNNIFSTLSWKDKRCSFLTKGGDCSIYEDRPLVCRTHNSTEKAELCKVEDGTSKTARHGQFYAMDLEVIQATLYLVGGKKSTFLHKII